MINHYHIIDSHGKTIGMVQIGPPPLTPYELCRGPFAYLKDGKWAGDKYNPTDKMCVCAAEVE